MIDPAYLELHRALIALHPREPETVVCPAAWYAHLRTIKAPDGLYCFRPSFLPFARGVEVGYLLGLPVLLGDTPSTLPELATELGRRQPIGLGPAGVVAPSPYPQEQRR